MGEKGERRFSSVQLPIGYSKFGERKKNVCTMWTKEKWRTWKKTKKCMLRQKQMQSKWPVLQISASALIERFIRHTNTAFHSNANTRMLCWCTEHTTICTRCTPEAANTHTHTQTPMCKGTTKKAYKKNRRAHNRPTARAQEKHYYYCMIKKTSI